MARSSLEYAFTPNKDEVTLRFLTQTDNGDVVVTLEMDEVQQTLTPFHFGDVWFQDGKKLTVTQGKWSNVAFGRVNNDNGKTLLIGYYEDERKINAPVDVQLVSGLKSLIGLTFSPSGPVTANGDPTFHEIELQTTGNNDLAQFILKSVGYVEKTVSAKRFDGNLTNMEYDKIVFSSLIKNYGFSASHPSFSYKNMNVLFSPSVASLDADEGLILAGGTDGDKDYKTYTISVTNNDNKRTFYLQMNQGSSNTWTWQDQEGNPQISVTTGAGTIRPYPGNSKQLVWSIPEDKNLSGKAYEKYDKTVIFTVKVPQGQTFCINHIALESGNDDFSFL